MKALSRHPPGRWLPWALLLALAALPLAAQAIGQPFYVALAARMLIYALAASALNLALGFGGMVSFGHALFFGIGSYAVALPSFHGLDNGFVHVGLALAASGVVALLTGLVSLRTAGIGFIMITLAFAQMGYFLFISLKQYGGDDGLAITATSRFGALDLGGINTVYLSALGLLALQTWWLHRLREAAFGMVLRAGRQNAQRVAAVGFAAIRYQLAAYVLSAMLCALAGVLLANLNAFASPGTFGWSVSAELIIIVVLGGLGSVFGPVLGAITFIGLEELLKLATDHWAVVLGPVIVLLALAGRSGLMGALNRLERAHSKPQPPAPHACGEDGPAAAGAPIASGGVRAVEPGDILQTDGLVKRYGALLVTDAVTLAVRRGELHAVIGPNGAGKTTLIHQLSGELRPDAGRIRFDGVDVTGMPIERRAAAGLLRSYQITSVFDEFTVAENALLAACGARGHGFHFLRPLRADREARAAAAQGIALAGLSARMDVPAADLGYGERRQLELAMALSANPRLLLLDEPMAGMGTQEALIVMSLLERLKGLYTIVLVEHDMDAVFRLADRISVLAYGRVIFTGTPDEVRAHPEVRAVYLGEEQE